jgi:RimJ/RimL family protein N-acetyltransferase
MIVRILTPEDAIPFNRLRRERLEQAPKAFAESIAEHEALPLSTVAARLSRSDDNFVVGAFSPERELAGMAGFARETRLKARHKAIIWGVYVRPRWRGQGVGRAVLAELLNRARSFPGLEQIRLTVATSQEAAKQLYQSLGFEVFGHERHALIVDGEYVDEDHMVLWLT